VALPFYQAREVFKINKLMHLVSLLDESLNTKRKRHIVGGILLNISLLCGGLAITVITLKTEVKNE
jgi:hypothetical protein